MRRVLAAVMRFFGYISSKWSSLHLTSATAFSFENAVYAALSRRGNGPKLFGERTWLEEKHTTNAKRKSWWKLHLSPDLVSGKIVCSDLTTDDIGDPTASLGLMGLG